MNTVTTPAIVLRRIDYAEADRIITVITPEHGKVSLVAKGARKIKSKLAGGIELFAENSIGYIESNRDIKTITSASIIRFYTSILRSLDRTQMGYQLLMLLDKNTDLACEKGYYDLIYAALEALNDENLPLALIELWFRLQLLQLQGRQPDFAQDLEGNPLDEHKSYALHPEIGKLQETVSGVIGADHIKLARFALMLHPEQLLRVKNAVHLSEPLLTALRTAL